MRSLMVCASAELAEGGHRIVPLRFRGESHTAIVLRHQGRVRAYLNRCVHMVRRLDCVHERIVDADSGRLTCSMHGIAYDPETGESLSVLCAGERLQALKSKEIDGQVCIVDKRISPLP
jgi:nitrite reductase/ring-hydroxylating ferredoxin subunit